MDKKDTYLIVAAVIICIVISCLSPFIASGDPDGLEKSAENVNASEEQLAVDNGIENLSLPAAIFPDYAGESSELVQVGVLILGAFITLAVGYGIAMIIRRN